jgi:hypothetical protein
MSLYKDASLVMIPSAYKDGKLYSIRPTDGSGDFTFSRGSNLAATRVDVNGLIEKGRENQILHSNAITTSPWGGPRIFSETQGHTGYDGSNNAWLIIPNSDNNTHYKAQSVSTTSGVNTISVYAKAGGYNYMTIRDDSSGSSYAKFDLANGLTESSGSNDITSKIESVGNGWYRCSLTYLETGTGNVLFYINETYILSAAYTGDEVSGVYFQDFQLEQGLVATDYIETGASTAQAGILEDMPRLDYSASCPSLLLEPQRSNLLEQAEYFGASYWSKANVDVELADTLSPDGFKNAYKITETSESGQHAINVFSSSRPNLSAGSHTHSCFVKVNGVEDIVFYNNGSSGGAGVNIDLSDGTYSNLTGGATAASVEPYSNNWYRITLTFTAVVGNSSPSIYLRTTGSYTGDGVSGIYMYGMQTESGSYPTSYIPTYGTSQTRSADDCQVDDLQSNGIVDTNWTYFFEWGKYVADRNFEIKNSLSTAFLFMVARMFRYNNAFGGVSTLTSLPSGANEGIKVAVRYDGSSLKVFRSDGITNEVTDMNTSLFGDFDFLRLDRAFDDSEEFKQLLIFPTALTDSECIALTTI